MQMVTTGWISEEPDAAGPALPVTQMLLARQQHRAGPLETALARSCADDVRAARDEAAFAPDFDERAAGFIARGYSPGTASQLSIRLGDTMAELADEEAKLEKAARRSERLHREHEAGRLTGLAYLRAMGDVDDGGDEDRVRLLTRRAESLRRQIAEANEAMSPPQLRESDGVEAASRHAHQVFAEVTRQRFAEAQAGRPEPRPFASLSRGAGRSAEHTGPDCWVCAAARERDAARAREDAVAVYGEIAR
jgi:hypothetical protein